MNSPNTLKLNCLTVNTFRYGSHLKLGHLISFSLTDGNHRQLGQERCVSTINATDVKCIPGKTSHIPSLYPWLWGAVLLMMLGTCFVQLGIDHSSATGSKTCN